MDAPNATAKPAGCRHTVTPHLVIKNALEALAFYKQAFGATELMAMKAPNGKLVHAEIQIGDSIVMIGEEAPEWGALSPTTLKGTPVTIHLQVPNVDAFIDQAVKAGAKVVMPPSDQFWGDRYGTIDDPFGHRWGVATHLRDVSHEEMANALRQMFGA
ncbi:glyoxalase [Opitutus sp. ER46]|nr:glyoxalase [Opitutus sp. ER46]